MNIDLGKIGISGRYRMVVHKDEAMKEIIHDTGEFDNLITNVGMNRWGEVITNTGSTIGAFRTLCGEFVLGSGQRPAAFTDTALQSPVKMAAGNVTLQSESSSYSRGWYEITVRYQSTRGEFAGNLSEIGIQHTSLSGPLWSRALILDMDGNPTTITVLPSDFLTCYYTLRIHIPQTDAVFNIDVDYGSDGGIVPTVVTARPLSTEIAAPHIGWGLQTLITRIWAWLQFYTGGLAVPTAYNPLGTPIGNQTDSFTAVPYITDSYQRFATREDGLNDHLGDNLRTAKLEALYGAWQLEFDPPLKKNNTQTMNLTFGYSWARA